MDRGKVIIEGDAKECKKFKRDTYLWMSITLIFAIFFGNFVPDTTTPIILAKDIRVVLLYIFSIGVLLYIMIGIGAKINLFGVYEKGISPPAKPWSKVFAREYFIPYSEIKEVKIENAPVYYELILKNGKRIPIKAWWLYKFIKGDYKKVEKIMKEVARFVEDQNKKQGEGKDGERGRS